MERDWNNLIFGTYNVQRDILPAVDDGNWQRFRLSLKNMPLDHRYDELLVYVTLEDLSDDERRLRQIRVTNYVHALKRGGMWK
jgi:hypothetical protein